MFDNRTVSAIDLALKKHDTPGWPVVRGPAPWTH